MPELGNDAGLGGAANAESFKRFEELVSALDAMSPDDSAGARLREEATILTAGATRHNQAAFRTLFSMYFSGVRKTGAAEMTQLLRQKLEESLRRHLRKLRKANLSPVPRLLENDCADKHVDATPRRQLRLRSISDVASHFAALNSHDSEAMARQLLTSCSKGSKEIFGNCALRSGKQAARNRRTGARSAVTNWVLIRETLTSTRN